MLAAAAPTALAQATSGEHSPNMEFAGNLPYEIALANRPAPGTAGTTYVCLLGG